MKRKLALVIALFILATAMLPAQIFAAGDKGLESAITTAKTLFDIPDNYTQFDYNSNTSNGKTLWYLYWSKENEGSVNVVVDDRGTIITYSNYKFNYDNQRKLPKFSEDEAQKAAEDFLNRVNPDALKQIKLDDSGISYLNDPYYYFHYYRIYNGIPFPDNRIEVTVSKQTGEVQSYYYNWDDDLNFPDADKKITLADAQKAYQDKLGLRLVYKSNNDPKNAKVYLAYIPVFNSNICIDALTGEKLELNTLYYTDGKGGFAVNDSNADKTSREKAVTLSPEELKAIQDVTKLLTQDEAETKARAIEQLELTDEYTVVRSGISKNWLYQNEFTWELYFEKSTEDKNGERYYADVTLDGITGEIESFYRNYNTADPSDEVKYTRDEAKAAVDEFLNSLIPDRVSDLQYDNTAENIADTSKEAPRYYDFSYIRQVNGVPFIDNSVSAGIDAVTGKIQYFSLTWNKVDFPSADKVLSMDNAYEKLFSKIGLKLQYKLNQSGGIYPKYDMDQSLSPEVSLVYMTDDAKPAQLDANTGDVTNYDGTAFVEAKPISYTDIAGHFAEKEINTLAEYGVGFAGMTFKPDDSITQKDFFSLLSIVMGYINPSPYDEMTQDEVDSMYNYLIRDSIVKTGEKNPAAGVTREESMKFIIRALKFDKVAALPGIFTCKFADAADIDPVLYGYVTIGAALKLVNGDNHNNFNPKLQLSRGEAATIIYRMLSIE